METFLCGIIPLRLRPFRPRLIKSAKHICNGAEVCTYVEIRFANVSTICKVDSIVEERKVFSYIGDSVANNRATKLRALFHVSGMDESLRIGSFQYDPRFCDIASKVFYERIQEPFSVY